MTGAAARAVAAVVAVVVVVGAVWREPPAPPNAEPPGFAVPILPSPQDYLETYNTDRAHTGRLTGGRVPADIVFGARKTRAVR